MHRSCISSHQATHLISHRISSQIALPISLRVIFHVATSSRCSIAVALISIILLQCTHTHTHTHIETHPFNAVGNTSPPFVALTFDLFSIFHTFHHTINVYMDMSNTPAATHSHTHTRSHIQLDISMRQSEHRHRHPFDTHCLIIMKNEIEFLLHFHWIHLEKTTTNTTTTHTTHNNQTESGRLARPSGHPVSGHAGALVSLHGKGWRAAAALLLGTAGPGAHCHRHSQGTYSVATLSPSTHPPFTALISHRPLHRSCTASRWKSK